MRNRLFAQKNKKSIFSASVERKCQRVSVTLCLTNHGSTFPTILVTVNLDLTRVEMSTRGWCSH